MASPFLLEVCLQHSGKEAKKYGISPLTLHHRVSKSKSSPQVLGYKHASSRKRCPHKFTIGKCTSSYITTVSPKIKLTLTTSKSKSDVISVVTVLVIVSSFLGCGFFLLVTNDDSLLLLDDSCTERCINFRWHNQPHTKVYPNVLILMSDEINFNLFDWALIIVALAPDFGCGGDGTRASTKPVLFCRYCKRKVCVYMELDYNFHFR